MGKKIVIVAPHPDDEIIGCYSILNHQDIIGKDTCICYGSHLESWTLLFLSRLLRCATRQIMDETNLPKVSLYFFPDPYFEMHPAHRMWGTVGERLLRRNEDIRVIFYSVNMRAPYIFEVPNPDGKRRLLEKVYPEKKSLWEYDHRYFLFEGYCEWNPGRGIK